MLKYDSDEFVNIGTGKDISIRELAELITEVVGYRGGIVFDTTKPNGTQRKLLDVTRLLTLGWKPKIGLRAGIAQTYEWFLKAMVDQHNDTVGYYQSETTSHKL